MANTPAKPATASPLLRLSLLTSIAAAAALSVAYVDAGRPDLSLIEAELQAGSALRRIGYDWASVKIDGGFAHIHGQAPGEAERVIAYDMVRKTLRPLMGKARIIAGVSSHVTLSPEATAAIAAAAAPGVQKMAEAPVDTKIENTPGNKTSVASAETRANAVPDVAPPTIALTEQRMNAEAAASAYDAAEKTTPGVFHASDADILTDIFADSIAAANPASIAVAAATPPHERATADAAGETAADIAAIEQSRPEVPATADSMPSTAGTEAIETASFDKSHVPAMAAAGTDARSETAATTAHVEDAKSRCNAEFSGILASKTIVFAPDSATIDKQSRGLLDKLAAIAKRCIGFTLVVGGHADGSGGKAHNMALSTKRAEAVRWALIDRGVDMDHISAIAYGASRPLQTSAGGDTTINNRRIDFSIQEPASLRHKASAQVGKR
ncbi:MAG: OmpA family protein [Hyphomicrobium sp.]